MRQWILSGAGMMNVRNQPLRDFFTEGIGFVVLVELDTIQSKATAYSERSFCIYRTVSSADH